MWQDISLEAGPHRGDKLHHSFGVTGFLPQRQLLIIIISALDADLCSVPTVILVHISKESLVLP